MDSKVMAAYRNRGAIYGILERHDEALIDYEKVIELYDQGLGAEEGENNISGDYFNRGICRLRLGFKGDGCADLKKAQALGYEVGPLISYCE
jgi:tetratricopeptide (TPR) repeat protein